VRYVLWAQPRRWASQGARQALDQRRVGHFSCTSYARARGQWGTDEATAGTAEEVSFPSAEDHIASVAGFSRQVQTPTQRPPSYCAMACGRVAASCLPLALRFRRLATTAVL